MLFWQAGEKVCMKRFMWSFLALLIVACVGVYLAGGFECFAASPGTAGAAIPGDRTKAYITLGILIVAALLFVTEALPLPITAMLVPVGLSSTGVLTSKVAFSYFGDNTVVLFMAMFIIGESTFVTGFADRVGQMALKLSKGDMKKLLLFSMIAVGGLSTVLSNTGTTAVAVPMIMGMCASAKEQDFDARSLRFVPRRYRDPRGYAPKRHHQLHA